MGSDPGGGRYDASGARELLRRGREQHRCATTRQLADRLGVPCGAMVLRALGFRGAAGPAWHALAPELADEPDWPAAIDGEGDKPPGWPGVDEG